MYIEFNTVIEQSKRVLNNTLHNLVLVSFDWSKRQKKKKREKDGVEAIKIFNRCHNQRISDY